MSRHESLFGIVESTDCDLVKDSLKALWRGSVKCSRQVETSRYEWPRLVFWKSRVDRVGFSINVLEVILEGV